MGEVEMQRLRALASATAQKLSQKRQAPQALEPVARRRREEVEAHVGLQGAEAAAAAATAEGGDSYTLIEVPDEFTGLVIGKHGQGIKNLQAETGAVICVGKLATQGLRKVCITGSAESQAWAKESLLNFLERNKELKSMTVDYVELPNKFAGKMIGAQGQTISQVHRAYGVRATLDQCYEEPVRKLELRGTAENVVLAKRQVELLLLDLYRRSKIYNAPLENKYANYEAELPRCEPSHCQQDQEDWLKAWVVYYAGNMTCVSIFRSLQSSMVEEIPGLDA